MKPVLSQNGRKLKLKQSGLTGYSLLTDHNGEVFYQQIVQYMRDTLGSQGVQLLLNRMSERERKTQEADQNANTAESGDVVENYDSAMDQAAQESKNAQETPKGEFSTGQGNNSVVQPPSAVKNPITVIKRIMKMGVLELVLPPGKGISGKEINTGTLLSGREQQKGMDYSRKQLYSQHSFSAVSAGSSGKLYRSVHLWPGISDGIYLRRKRQ